MKTVPDSNDLMLIGIGNDGRSDDGLGWAFLDRIEQDGYFCGQRYYRYQLQIEDAELISRARQVIFVDACRAELAGGFQWRACIADPVFEYTSHALAPEAILYLCQTLYREKPSAHLLLIQGHAWEIKMGLSPQAYSDLDKAMRFFYQLPEARVSHLPGYENLSAKKSWGSA